MNQISNVNPENNTFMNKKHIKDLKKYSLFIPKEIVTIKSDMNIFIIKETNSFLCGKSMYKEKIAPTVEPMISLNLFTFIYKNLETDNKIK